MVALFAINQAGSDAVSATVFSADSIGKAASIARIAGPKKYQWNISCE